MKGFAKGAVLLTATTMASYIEPPFPGPTDAQEIFANLIHAAMPKPTEPPVLRFDWFRRQATSLSSAESSGTEEAASSGLSSEETDVSATSASATGDAFSNSTSNNQVGWLAPDNTCGYIGGSLGAALTCSSTEYCAAALITSPGLLACCGSATNAPCTFFQTCIDYNQYWSSSACNHACVEDMNTMKCTLSAYPYCYPYTIPGIDVLYHSCDAFTTSSPQPLLTTFIGEEDGRTWTPLYNTSSDSYTGTASALVNTQEVTDASSGSGAALGGNAATTTTTTPSSSPTLSPPQNKSSTPVGAIVGGVVGGLAVIGIAVGAIVFLCLRSRRKQRQGVPPGSGQPNMTQQQYAAPVQYDHKQPVEAQSPVPPRYSHVEVSQQHHAPAELSGDYHQPVLNPQTGQPVHELGQVHQPMH